MGSSGGGFTIKADPPVYPALHHRTASACDRNQALGRLRPRRSGRIGNGDSGYLQKQSNNRELCNHPEKVRKKIWRPHLKTYSSLRQRLSDSGDVQVCLDYHVHQIQIPDDFQAEERKGWAEGEEVDEGVHAHLPLLCE